MRLWQNSLPLRLAVITGSIFITVLFTALLASYLTTDYLLRNSVDSALTTLARSTAETWTNKDKPQEFPKGKDKEHRSYIQVVDSLGKVVYKFDREALPVNGDLLRKALYGEEVFTDALEHHGRFAVSYRSDWLRSFWPEEDGIRIVYWPLTDKDGKYVLQVGLSVSENAEMLFNLGQILLAISFAALLVVAATSAFLVWNTFKPLRKIIAVAEEIDSSTLTSRIEVPVKDSTLNRLIEVLNAMLKRLETAFETQTRFVNDAAHDLRTPLSALRSELEITLRQQRSEKEYVQALKACLIEVENMGSLTDNLLTLARFDSGLRSDIEKAVPLGPMLQRVNCELGEFAEKSRVSVIMNVEKDIKIDCSPLAIERLVRNLLHNSIRYTPAGGIIELHLRSGNGLGGRDGAEITISDTGIGINEQDLPHIFERFYRSDSARRRDGGGSGLGLSICQSIIKTHKGRIDFQSERGRGTTVTIWLP